jgi:hypothetical protein
MSYGQNGYDIDSYRIWTLREEPGPGIQPCGLLSRGAYDLSVGVEVVAGVAALGGLATGAALA